MEKKIYIVTSGDYSDYRIERVFSTKEKANEFVQQHGTDYRIEEYVVDEEIKKEQKLWLIAFDTKNNKLLSAVSHAPNDCNIEFIDTCKRQDSVCNDSSIIFWLEADTMDRAIKVAKERYFAIKSNEYIWMRLTRPCNDSLLDKYERFNIRTNEFIKPDTL